MLHVPLTHNKNLRIVVNHTWDRRGIGVGPAFFDGKNVKDELIRCVSRVIHLPRPQV